MGLDITAYKNLKEVVNPQIDGEGYPINDETEVKFGTSMKWSEKYFPGRGEGIDADKVYTWEDSIGFRAGSYSGYGRWRATLENFAEGNQFYELIEFADNEGTIGYVVSAKLYKDFKDNEDRAKKYSKNMDDGEYWFEKYKEWEEAFEYAKEHGAVNFC